MREEGLSGGVCAFNGSTTGTAETDVSLQREQTLCVSVGYDQLHNAVEETSELQSHIEALNQTILSKINASASMEAELFSFLVRNCCSTGKF